MGSSSRLEAAFLLSFTFTLSLVGCFLFFSISFLQNLFWSLNFKFGTLLVSRNSISCLLHCRMVCMHLIAGSLSSSLIFTLTIRIIAIVLLGELTSLLPFCISVCLIGG